MSEEGRRSYNNKEEEIKALFSLNQLNKPISDSNKVKTIKEKFSLTQIPLSSLQRLGMIFREGELKYGKGDWRNGVGNKEYQLERANHALKHLLIYIHELEYGEYLGEVNTQEYSNDNADLYIEEIEEHEDDLAKVMWFCATQIELERIEKNESKTE